jgi:hypothetical protein
MRTQVASIKEGGRGKVLLLAKEENDAKGEGTKEIRQALGKKRKVTSQN